MSFPVLPSDPNRRGAAAATVTTSTTGLIMWALERWPFHGQLPPEVYAWVQWAVPAAMGLVSAELVRLRGQRKAQPPAPPAVPPAA